MAPDRHLPPRQEDEDWYTALARTLVHALPIIVVLQFLVIFIVAVFAYSVSTQQDDIERNQKRLALQQQVLQHQQDKDFILASAARTAIRNGCEASNRYQTTTKDVLLTLLKRGQRNLRSLATKSFLPPPILAQQIKQGRQSITIVDNRLASRNCTEAARVIPIPQNGE